MPTYEYECLSCGKRFEVFQKITDEPLKTCPHCQKPLKRLIGSGSGIIFKGTGFYATDYRKNDNSKKENSVKPITCPQNPKDCSACNFKK